MYELWLSRDGSSWRLVSTSKTLELAKAIAKEEESEGFYYEIVDAKDKSLIKTNM